MQSIKIIQIFCKTIKKQKMMIMEIMMIMMMMMMKKLAIKGLFSQFLKLFISKEEILIKYGMKLKISSLKQS